MRTTAPKRDLVVARLAKRSATQRQISADTGVSESYIFKILTSEHAAHRAYIRKYVLEEGTWLAVWAVGDKAHAPKPPPLSNTEKWRRWAAKHPAAEEARRRRQTVARGFTPKTRDLGLAAQLRAVR